jgi:flagellar FliJ protein
LELQIKNVALEKIGAVENRFSGGIHQIRSYEYYILRLDQTRDKLLSDAALAELEVEKAREIYLEASRDRKVISGLRERQEKEYRRAMSLEEIKNIDDLTSGRAARMAARKIAAGL